LRSKFVPTNSPSAADPGRLYSTIFMRCRDDVLDLLKIVFVIRDDLQSPPGCSTRRISRMNGG